MTRAADPAEVLRRPAGLPDAVLRYAGHADGIVDVRLPLLPVGERRRPAALVVLLHGGFWRSAYDRSHIRPLADALAREGFVVATPEYRRLGAGGGWPTTPDDVRDAMTALPGLLGGLGVPTTTTTLLGHSAGGQLALWLTGEGVPVDRVVALAPVADLHAAHRERLGDGAVAAFLGGAPEEVPERYDASDPLRRVAPAADVEIVLVHGTGDEEVPVTQSRSLAAAHPDVRLVELAGVGHYAVIDPLSPAWPVVRRLLLEPPEILGGRLEA